MCSRASRTHFRSHEAAIALDEVAVHLRGQSTLVEQAGPLHRTVLAVAGQPAQGVGVELVARVVTGVSAAAVAAVAAAANLLDDAVSLEGQEQEPDGLVRLGAPEGLSGRQMGGEGAPEILPVGAVGRDEVAPSLSLPAGARPGDDGARQLAFVIQIPDRAFLETQLRLLDKVVLLPRVEDVDLHGKRASDDIEQGPKGPFPEIGGGEAKRVRDGDEAFPPAAFTPPAFAHGESGLPQLVLGQQAVGSVESLVLEAEQAAVLQIRRRHPPAALQMAVQEVFERSPQGIVGALSCRAAHFRVGREVVEARVHGVEDGARQIAVAQYRAKRTRDWPCG